MSGRNADAGCAAADYLDLERPPQSVYCDGVVHAEKIGEGLTPGWCLEAPIDRFPSTPVNHIEFRKRM